MFGPPRKEPGGGGNIRCTTKGYTLITVPTNMPSTATCSQRRRGRRSNANNEPATHATIVGKMIPPPVNHARPVIYMATNVPRATRKLSASVFTSELDEFGGLTAVVETGSYGKWVLSAVAHTFDA